MSRLVELVELESGTWVNPCAVSSVVGIEEKCERWVDIRVGGVWLTVQQPLEATLWKLTQDGAFLDRPEVRNIITGHAASDGRDIVVGTLHLHDGFDSDGKPTHRTVRVQKEPAQDDTPFSWADENGTRLANFTPPCSPGKYIRAEEEADVITETWDETVDAVRTLVRSAMGDADASGDFPLWEWEVLTNSVSEALDRQGVRSDITAEPATEVLVAAAKDALCLFCSRREKGGAA